MVVGTLGGARHASEPNSKEIGRAESPSDRASRSPLVGRTTGRVEKPTNRDNQLDVQARQENKRSDLVAPQEEKGRGSNENWRSGNTQSR